MKLPQYAIGKDYLYYFYRFVVLRWELEWKNSRFLISEGTLKEYCENNKISIKSFPTADELRIAIDTLYEEQTTDNNGAIWFVRVDTKPKDLLRHLRNCFAHGNYMWRQKHKAQCVTINCIDKNRIKAKGFVPLEIFKPLINAALSCMKEG